jgi:hypothetical protein
MSSRARMIVGIAMAAVGLVWLGQGTGILQGSSFMVGDPLWAVIGLVLLAAGAALAISGWRRRPPAA